MFCSQWAYRVTERWVLCVSHLTTESSLPLLIGSARLFLQLSESLMLVANLLDALFHAFPLDTAEAWDHVGLSV